MQLEILNREALFDNGFGLLLEQLENLKSEIRNQSALVQNEIQFSEEEFNDWWEKQNKFLKELNGLSHNWTQIHQVVAENRHWVGTPLPSSKFR